MNAPCEPTIVRPPTCVEILRDRSAVSAFGPRLLHLQPRPVQPLPLLPEPFRHSRPELRITNAPLPRTVLTIPRRRPPRASRLAPVNMDSKGALREHVSVRDHRRSLDHHHVYLTACFPHPQILTSVARVLVAATSGVATQTDPTAARTCSTVRGAIARTRMAHAAWTLTSVRLERRPVAPTRSARTRRAGTFAAAHLGSCSPRIVVARTWTSASSRATPFVHRMRAA